MSSQPTTAWASLVSQRKLLSSFGARARDNLTLHRWVLLKNFASHIESPEPTSAAAAPVPMPEEPIVEEEVFVFPDEDVFVFPDILAQAGVSASALDEARWLDALLEELDSDDDDEPDTSADDDFVQVRSAPAPLSPPAPVSSPSPVRPTLLSDPDLVSSSPATCKVSSTAPTTPPPSPSFSDEDEFPFPYGHLESYASDDNDVSSDEESEGPQTPLMHSAVVADTPIVSAESEFYFFHRAIAGAPILENVSALPTDC